MGNDEIMYETIIGMESVGKFKSFKEATIKFFKEIESAIQNGVSWQWLETTNFLVRTDSSSVTGVMSFYDVRDFACEIGLLFEGKIQEKVYEPTPGVVLKTYQKSAEKMIAAELQALFATFEQILKLTV